MSEEENHMPEWISGREEALKAEVGMELQQWAEQYYANLVEEKRAEEEPSMLDQLLEEVGEYVDQEIEKLPPEEQEAAEMKLVETADALVDTLDAAYQVTEKACDSIIDSLDELEKWMDKW